MRVVDAYEISPSDIRPGDVMMFVVKAMVGHDGTYRIYRCRYNGSDVPQGSRILHEKEVAQDIFPSLAQAATPDDS